MATVKIYLPHLSGYITGPNTLTLKLTKTSDASAVNGAGDALTESGTSGWFSATVAETWDEVLGAALIDQDGLCPYFGKLNVGSTIISDSAVDALSVETYSELSSPPTASSTLSAKLTWLFMWARNKATQTVTERKLYADDGTTVISTESVSDAGGTFTKGEAS